MSRMNPFVVTAVILTVGAYLSVLVISTSMIPQDATVKLQAVFWVALFLAIWGTAWGVFAILRLMRHPRKGGFQEKPRMTSRVFLVCLRRGFLSSVAVAVLFVSWRFGYIIMSLSLVSVSVIILAEIVYSWYLIRHSDKLDEA